ncbi:MAG: hypothetical protein LUE86_02460 [Clostridiales bacterium]|nr:hypothetical protein [Clostridiales bacterium]
MYEKQDLRSKESKVTVAGCIASQWQRASRILHGAAWTTKGGISVKEYGNKERVEDFNYFLAHYDEFFKQYGEAFIAIKEKKVLGVYDSIGTAVGETTKQYPRGTFIVQECNGTESAYTDCFHNCQFVGI